MPAQALIHTSWAASRASSSRRSAFSPPCVALQYPDGTILEHDEGVPIPTPPWRTVGGPPQRFGLLADAPVRLAHLPWTSLGSGRRSSPASFPISSEPVPPPTNLDAAECSPARGDRLPVRGTPMGRSVDRSGVVSLRQSSVRGGEGHRPLLGHRYRRRRAACRRGQMGTPWGSKKSSRS